MKDIIPLQNPDPRKLFSPGGLSEIIARIETDVRAVVPDASTSKGRKEIAGLAAKVARSKTYLDGIGKEHVAELKSMPRKIDAERKAMRDRLDALKEEVRRPLTEYEQQETDRKAAIRARLNEFANPVSGNASDIRTRLATLEAVAIDDTWEEFGLEAAKAKDSAILQARSFLAEAEEHERMEAERVAREEKERREREARIAAEAGERAKREAERESQVELLRHELARNEAERLAEQSRMEKEDAKRRQQEAEQRAKDQAEQAVQAERERIEAEQERRAEEERQRAANLAHRKQVHEYMAAELRQHVISLDAAKDLVAMIAAGKIANLKIIY